MPRSEEDEKLEQQLEDLQHDWNSYKKSIPAIVAAAPLPTSTVLLSTRSSFCLLHNSPKQLLLSIQQTGPPPSSSDGSIPMTAGRNAEDIAIKRREAIRSGRLQGRRLLEELECEKDEEEVCSVCSSAMIGCSNGIASCPCSSSLIEEGGDDEDDVGVVSSLSSLSLDGGERVKISGSKSKDAWRWQVWMPLSFWYLQWLLL